MENTVENPAEVTTENMVTEKSAEQIASERNLENTITGDFGGIELESNKATEQKELVSASVAVKSILSVVPMGLDMAGLKNAAAVWDDAALLNISGALVPVMQKYAFGQKMLTYLQTGGGIAEGVLLMAVWPIAEATYTGYQLDKAEIANKAAIENNAKLFENFEPVAGKVYDAGTEKGSTFKYAEAAQL